MSPSKIRPMQKGYGKDLAVNGILAFCGAWRPNFLPSPSEANVNVSDAVSRGGDDSRARTEGSTQVRAPVDEVMQVLGEASVDIDFACHGAPERLLDCLFGRCRRLVGRGCAGRAQKCAPRHHHPSFRAVWPAGRSLRYDQKGATAP